MGGSVLLHNGCEMVKNHGLNMVDVEDTLAARHLAAKSQSAKLECLQWSQDTAAIWSQDTALSL